MHIFHEGLPGSGKSYETLVEHIIPSLKKGRHVFARINGLNFEKIAELADITPERCKELLHEVSEEDIFKIDKIATNDSLVIIDELQNFFPSGRAKLSDDITKFVTEHRHRGLDIVTMGQSIADVHNLWRRRTQRKVQFLKLDMLGQEKRYRWTSYQGTLDGKGEIRFTKVNSGVKKYDEKYFGSYASHQADTENTENYKDKRANIFNTSVFKFWLPLFLLGLGFAVWHLIGFFKSPDALVKTDNPPSQSQTQGQTAQAPQTAPAKPRPKAADWVQENEIRYTSKMTYLQNYKGMVWDMLVVWVDSADRVYDQVYRDDLLAMGYRLKYVGYGVEATKGEFRTVFRFKPTAEAFGAVPKNIQDQLVTEY